METKKRGIGKIGKGIMHAICGGGKGVECFYSRQKIGRTNEFKADHFQAEQQHREATKKSPWNLGGRIDEGGERREETPAATRWIIESLRWWTGGV